MIRKGKPDLSRSGTMRDRPFNERERSERTWRDNLVTVSTRRYIQQVVPTVTGGGGGSGEIIDLGARLGSGGAQVCLGARV